MGGKFKSHLKKIKFRRLHTWQLILILIPLLFLTATLMRFDHIKMTELRKKVDEADKLGNIEEISASLEELSAFVRNNIVINIVEENGSLKVSFGTGPFYLKESYNRAANQAIEEAQANLTGDSNPYGNIFAEAMNICKPQAIANGWTWSDQSYIDCMTGEINKYPSSENLFSKITADVPSTELYRREFSSRIWAPTFSGFMILICLILIVVIFIRFIIWIIIRLSLLFL
ncbi:hypothetical protein IKG45_03190 [Candidatus Saccharibacteria bacterium]|nr:hypothetical protein [Candidatus Saccharibacteria bacterium]